MALAVLPCDNAQLSVYSDAHINWIKSWLGEGMICFIFI
jgi:hypothetical protein